MSGYRTRHPRGTVIERGMVRDVLTIDDDIVVLVADPPLHRVVRLSALGAELLDVVGERATVGDLEDELRRRLGEPPAGAGELADILTAAIDQLAESGLLVVKFEHKKDHSDVTGS